MILRRFTKHVSDQNWFAVGLDVLVVITGIFLGMQVTEWNEDRKAIGKERYYVDRLIAELEGNATEYETDHPEQIKMFEASFEAARMMAGNFITEENFTEFKQNFGKVFFVPGLPDRPMALDALVAASKLDMVRSLDMQREIRKFNGQLSDDESQVGKSGSLIGEAIVRILQEVDYGLIQGKLADVTSADRFMQSKVLINNARMIGRHQQIIAKRGTLLHAERMKFLELLRAYRNTGTLNETAEETTQ